MTKVRRFLKRKYSELGIPHAHVRWTLEDTPLEAHYLSLFRDSFSVFLRSQASLQVFRNPSGSVDFIGVLLLASPVGPASSYEDLVHLLASRGAFGPDPPASTALRAPPPGQTRHDAFAPGTGCLLVPPSVWPQGLLLEWGILAGGMPVHVRLQCDRVMVPRPTAHEPDRREECARPYLRLLKVEQVRLVAKSFRARSRRVLTPCPARAQVRRALLTTHRERLEGLGMLPDDYDDAVRSMRSRVPLAEALYKLAYPSRPNPGASPGWGGPRSCRGSFLTHVICDTPHCANVRHCGWGGQVTNKAEEVVHRWGREGEDNWFLRLLASDGFPHAFQGPFDVYRGRGEV